MLKTSSRKPTMKKQKIVSNKIIISTNPSIYIPPVKRIFNIENIKYNSEITKTVIAQNPKYLKNKLWYGCIGKRIMKGEKMSGWEIIIVAALVYWLVTK